MTTAAQIEANSATNAQLSTGPRSPEGKARSAANSTKLGLYAAQAVLLTEEDRTEFDALESAYSYELRPFTPVERTLFSQLVLAAWNIQRANRLEAALAADEGVDPLLSAANEKTLARITTARMRAERTFHKSLKELRASQAAPPKPKPIVKNEANYVALGVQPYVRPTPNVGRNEACPCQSGRKFKHCCLENEANPLPIDPAPAVNSSRMI